jgi:hypothetical protein
METPFEKYFRIQNDPDSWNDPSFSIEAHGKGFAPLPWTEYSSSWL